MDDQEQSLPEAACGLIESLVSSCRFEDSDTYPLEQWKELAQLEAAIYKFNQANTDKVFVYPDYTQVVLVNQAYV